MKSIAYYFGRPTPNEPFISAFARALGYSRECDMDKDLKHKTLSFVHHHHRACGKLLEKFNISSFGELPTVAEQMYAGMADWYKQQECEQWLEILQSINEEFSCRMVLDKQRREGVPAVPDRVMRRTRVPV